MIIRRDVYLKRLIDREWNGMVKIITGIRRCGKSFLLFNLFRSHLIEKGVREDQIIDIRLDIPSSKKYCGSEALYNHIIELVGRNDAKYYVLLDEIQMVDDFESVLNGLNALSNVDVYVTGSNSKLLSKDIVTEFRGRGDVVELRPLSFHEFYSVYEGSKYDAWKDYMDYGGLPEIAALSDTEQKSAYLSKVVNTIYLRDIAERNQIRYADVLDNITDSLFSSIGSLTNPTKIANTFSSKGNKVGRLTVSKYIDCLCDAYLFEISKRYDLKGKAYIGHLAKYYSADVGIRNAKLNFRQNEYSHIMENIVYNELRCRGFTVDIGVVERRCDIGKKSVLKKYEIDFIANKGSKRYYVQSAFSIENDVKKESEIRPFLLTKDFFRKIVVVGFDVPSHLDDYGIKYVNVIDFLLDENSLDD